MVIAAVAVVGIVIARQCYCCSCHCCYFFHQQLTIAAIVVVAAVAVTLVGAGGDDTRVTLVASDIDAGLLLLSSFNGSCFA